MVAKLGSYEFTAHVGPPPQLPRATVVPFSRPGTAGTGAKIHATQAPEFQLQLVAHGAESARVGAQNGYRTSVGTILQMIIGATDYDSLGWRVLVLGVEVLESRALVGYVGRNYAGSPVSHFPAGRIVTQWRLQAVPHS
jgi:hypothetical protein